MGKCNATTKKGGKCKRTGNCPIHIRKSPKKDILHFYVYVRMRSVNSSLDDEYEFNTATIKHIIKVMKNIYPFASPSGDAKVAVKHISKNKFFVKLSGKNLPTTKHKDGPGYFETSNNPGYKGRVLDIVKTEYI